MCNQDDYSVPYREGFFRLGISGNSDLNNKQFPDVTPEERKECDDFYKDVFNFCKEVVQETVKEQGYKFVSKGKGKEKVLVKEEPMRQMNWWEEEEGE